VSLTSNSSGNFTLSTAAATQLVFPVTVKVMINGKTREMIGAAPDGDCNRCHTEAGANGAPGRILAP
jgi:hypothetical protein